ncbi:unnamed protein product [Peniophora sp. CBMAI 1063]|nr:unnamed protein product [Peniophora sp. CBMAI 1063]
MASFSITNANYDDQQDSSLDAEKAATSSKDAFQSIWYEALRRCEQSASGVPSNSSWQSLLRRMELCNDSEAVCLVLDETMESFERFGGNNTAWDKLRNKYLKPTIEVLLLFSDVVAETATSFPQVPGGKAVFAAFTVLLQATKGVSAYCEALIVLFEELNGFMASLRHRLQVPASLGPASRTIAITILAHLLNVVNRATKLIVDLTCDLALYGKALLKDQGIQGELQRLRALTNLEVRAIVSELRVETSHIREVGTKNTEITNRLLSEFQQLNRHHTQDAAAGGIMRRGIGTLIRGQRDIMALLRSEREQRERFDTSDSFEKLSPVRRADIDAQSAEGCMRGTRVAILKGLKAWAHDQAAPRIYWLNGMAGTGKSAIARSFGQCLKREQRLGGSFFCSRGGSVEEGDAQRIIPTLAASMASRHPGFSKALLAKLHDEPFSSHWNLSLQLEWLLAHPLSTFGKDSRMLVLVIDALDECSDEDATGYLLSRLVRLSAMMPVKFFVTSRPEPHIRRQLEHLDPALGHVLRLHDIEQDIVAADISLYLSHGLRSMREPFFPLKWPRKADIDALTRLSGKLFIYAFTALQYLRRDPLLRLPKLTGTIVTAGRTMYQPLDDIYTLILEEALDPTEYEQEEIDLSCQIIATVVTYREPMTMDGLGSLLKIPPSHLRASLNRLYAVIYVPVRDDAGVLSTFHASFSDFLNTAERAPERMRQPVSKSHLVLANACIETLQSNLHFNMSGAFSSHHPNTKQGLTSIHDALHYACLYWAHHITAVMKSELRHPDRTIALHRILEGHEFLFWLEALSAMGLVDRATDILQTARSLSLSPDDDWLRLLDELIGFTERFSPAIAQSAPHIYLSASPFYGHGTDSVRRHASETFLDLPWLSNDACYSLLPLRAVFSRGNAYRVVITEGGFYAYETYDREAPYWNLSNSSFTGFVSPSCRYVAAPTGGTYVAYILEDSIRCYDISGGESLPGKDYNITPRGVSPAEVDCMAFCEQNGVLALALHDEQLWMWDTQERRLRWKHKHGSYSRVLSSLHVHSMTFSEDGRLLATGHPMGTVFVWNVDASVAAFSSIRAHTVGLGLVNCIAFRLEQGIFGTSDGTVCLWDVSSSTIVMQSHGHEGPVTSIVFSDDGTRAVSGSADRTMRVWDAIARQPLRRIEVLQPVRAIASASPKCPNQVLCTTDYGAVQLWDLELDSHPPHCSSEGWDKIRLDDDGWIRGSRGELLLWISEEHRKTLTHPQCRSVIYGGRLEIDWDKLPHGTSWPCCFEGKRLL